MTIRSDLIMVVRLNPLDSSVLNTIIENRHDAATSIDMFVNINYLINAFDSRIASIYRGHGTLEIGYCRNQHGLRLAEVTSLDDQEQWVVIFEEAA